MEKNSVRKVWETPKVFVLGAEGTQSYAKSGKHESAVTKSVFSHNTKSDFNKLTEVQVNKGYQS